MHWGQKFCSSSGQQKVQGYSTSGAGGTTKKNKKPMPNRYGNNLTVHSANLQLVCIWLGPHSHCVAFSHFSTEFLKVARVVMWLRQMEIPSPRNHCVMGSLLGKGARISCPQAQRQKSAAFSRESDRRSCAKWHSTVCLSSFPLLLPWSEKATAESTPSGCIVAKAHRGRGQLSNTQ